MSTDPLSALTEQERAAIERLRDWLARADAVRGAYPRAGAAVIDAVLVCDAVERLAQENARLRKEQR